MDKYQELKNNLIELYNYAKTHYHKITPLTQKEKELLVRWSHIILKTFNPLTSVYNYDSSIALELKAMFFGIYRSVTPLPIDYQIKNLINTKLNKKLDSQEISIIKDYLSKIKITYPDADPDLTLVNLRL